MSSDFEEQEPVVELKKEEVKQKVAEKPQPKQEVHNDNSPAEAETPRVLLSSDDAYIHDRMKAQPKTLEELNAKVTENRDDSTHRLSLPDELKEYGKKYAFRWLMKHKQALDYACDVRGWKLVNRSYFPDLPRHFFTVSGSFERGDAILAFMPIERAEQLRQEPGRKSSDILNSFFGKHADDPRYYKPKDSESNNVKMI